MTGRDEKMPPSSETAERSLLGCALLDPCKVLDICQRYSINTDAFYFPACGVVFNALAAMLEEGCGIDLHTVTEYMTQRGTLEKAGGYATLEGMVDEASTPQFAEYYARLVLEAWQKRRIIQAAREIIEEAEKTQKPRELVLTAPNKFADIPGALEKAAEHGAIIQQRIDKWRENKKRRAGNDAAIIVDGLEAPWKRLTKILCGIQPGLYVVAGRPSAGKTTVEEQVAMMTAKNGVGVLRFSMDVTREQLLDRSVCRLSGVSLPKMKQGYAGEHQYKEAERTIATITAAPMWIVDDCFRVETICARARMMKARHNIGLITIDYLQLMRLSGSSSYINDNENARMTEIMAILKELWKSLGIPILLLSQLNRAVEKEERDPRMSDLRGSGSIEQDATAVIFLFRELKKIREMMDKDRRLPIFKRPIRMMVIKNNQGECGSIPMWMYPHYFRHDEAEEGPNGEFGNDQAPEDLGRINDMCEDRPEFMPRLEGEKAPGRVLERENSKSEAQNPK